MKKTDNMLGLTDEQAMDFNKLWELVEQTPGSSLVIQDTTTGTTWKITKVED